MHRNPPRRKRSLGKRVLLAFLIATMGMNTGCIGGLLGGLLGGIGRVVAGIARVAVGAVGAVARGAGALVRGAGSFLVNGGANAISQTLNAVGGAVNARRPPARAQPRAPPQQPQNRLPAAVPQGSTQVQASPPRYRTPQGQIVDANGRPASLANRVTDPGSVAASQGDPTRQAGTNNATAGGAGRDNGGLLTANARTN